MEKCGCYDPGFILGLLTGAQNGRALNVWLQREMEQAGPVVEVGPVTEKDIAWMGETAGAPGLLDLLTLSRAGGPGKETISDLSLDIKSVQGFKPVLAQFLSLLSGPVRLIRLVYPALDTDIQQTKIHLTIRLLRSILIKQRSEALLLPNLPGSGLDKDTLWGNTLNEAQLVYNDDLPRVLGQCLRDGDARIMSEWAGMLHLPGTNVAYFNELPLETLPDQRHIFPALAASLALSGLPGISGNVSGTDLEPVRRLLLARKASAVFQPASAQMVIDLDRRVFALLKISPDALYMALCLTNLSGDTVQLHPDAASLGLNEECWLDLISNQPFSMGESGITLPAYGAVWLAQAV